MVDIMTFRVLDDLVQVYVVFADKQSGLIFSFLICSAPLYMMLNMHKSMKKIIQ